MLYSANHRISFRSLVAGFLGVNRQPGYVHSKLAVALFQHAFAVNLHCAGIGNNSQIQFWLFHDFLFYIGKLQKNIGHMLMIYFQLDFLSFLE